MRTDWNGPQEGAWFIPGSAGRYHVRIPEAHAFRLISRAGKKVRWRPLYLGKLANIELSDAQ